MKIVAGAGALLLAPFVLVLSIVIFSAGPTASASASVGTGGWASPAAGTISSGYGPRLPICTLAGCSLPFHYGVDIANRAGTPIYAASGGTVTEAGPAGTLGNAVTIDHGNGLTTRYGHMVASGIYVKVGDTVTAGQQIAVMGCSGVCTGPHVYFQVKQNGTAVDPIAFLKSAGVTVG